MKKGIIFLVLLALAIPVFAGTNVNVDQMRWKAITWEDGDASYATIDTIETAVYSDWFYLGDGNLYPQLLTFTSITDIADSATCTIKLQVSNDKTNNVTTLVALETISNSKVDSVYEAALTTIPVYVYGRIVIASTVVGSYTVAVQRSVVY